MAHQPIQSHAANAILHQSDKVARSDSSRSNEQRYRQLKTQSPGQLTADFLRQFAWRQVQIFHWKNPG